MSEARLREAFFAMVFSCTTDTIETEKAMRKNFKTMIIPTPREISKSCGFAIRFADVEEEKLIAAVKCVEVPHALYFLSSKDKWGTRTASLIEEVSEC
ncbi:DUF3343 domain-containing protein [Anaerovorax odorimutans]|uniref:DUF3343 domain-containing protein n=1 Tax=Anaerovorax odorimutans TaxID=109327 RepID=A0ABT1RMR0_9FIRM|nr:DUF3343 domain-containing protein [Anaerovorax odorimutans]MCQ4636464.1 DUF3343 domain-containing protein [Anaerovorax odorimutans]